MAGASATERSSIAGSAQACLVDFQTLRIILNSTDGRSRSEHADLSGRLQDESDRFRLWCGNIGAHRRGRISLDHRLREASHIKEWVVELLSQISSLIDDIRAIVDGRNIPSDAEPGYDTDELNDSDSESELDEESSATELQDIACCIGDIISNLMQLSSTIRNPAPHDQFQRSGNIDTSHYEPFDIEHVRHRFPRSEEFLVVRLGRAISRRRQYLRYREEHRARLAEGLDAVADDETFDAEGTVASSIPAQGNISSKLPGLGEVERFNDEASQTSYASSTADATSLRPPPLPKEGRDGLPFECPLCHYFTSIEHDIVWQKHVYSDLQPYVRIHGVYLTID
jgi:hypothetical protein